MLRNRPVSLVFVVLIGLGCQKAPEPVFVDVTQVPTVQASTIQQVQQRPPIALGSVSVHATPHLPDPDYVGLIRSYVDAEGKQLQARRDTAERERRTILNSSEFDKYQREQMAMFNAQREALAEKGQQAIYAKLMEISVPRGKAFNTLGVLAGFPDPDPKSDRKAVDQGSLQAKRYLLFRDLRAKIAELDQEYRLEAQRILDQTQEEIDKLYAETRADIERRRADLQHTVQIAASSYNVEQEIENASTLVKPHAEEAHPGPAEFKLELSASTPPNVPSLKGIGLNPSALLTSEVQVWAAKMGYRLVTSRTEGRDATEEFLRWRQRFQDGP